MPPTDPPLKNAPSFIETQFPVAKLSLESYKERTGKQSQTLTGLGKWWGRKPLVLVRAVLLGLLLPATNDPQADLDVFLKLMTMDEAGLWRRKQRTIPGKRLVQELLSLPATVQQRFLDPDQATASVRRFGRSNVESAEREALQRLVFSRMSYGEKLTYCVRPEQIDGPDPAAWQAINAHLHTTVDNLVDLVQELGRRRFGRVPRVGDAFCGAGSIPFESARLGCDAYGSDLNPVAALLTWASLNIIGGGEAVVEEVRSVQETVFAAVDRQITEWGIEHNSLGWRADAYLYCLEVTDPESGWLVPLAPSWVIGYGTKTVAKLVPDAIHLRYDIEIREGVSQAEMKAAKASGTMKGFRLMPPHGSHSTPLTALRKGLRLWGESDFEPRPSDIFRERLYCIRWVEEYVDEKGRSRTRRHYRAPTSDDLRREERVRQLLAERFSTWQELGYIPSRRVRPGKDINRPRVARGWTYWHHSFNPRQLLVTGLFSKYVSEAQINHVQFTGLLLAIGRLADWNSRQSRWDSSSANEKGAQAFYKPSLATPPVNYCCRATPALDTVFLFNNPAYITSDDTCVTLGDARQTKISCDLWITDPPYADAVNYHELSEYYLAWYSQQIKRIFPDWYSDSKRSLAVKGDSEHFRPSMVEAYKQLKESMPDDGMQVVMFTHQDAAVWADLTMILWAAGLRVTAAWTIATETDSALKQGNYVQGTVCLVLRKRTETAPRFLDEIHYAVEDEVRRQLSAMQALDDGSDPNFGDADYQLAAYAAALRVLTAQPIEEIDPAREILRPRQSGESNPIERLIEQAVKIAADHLVPHGFERDLWKQLSAMERFYLKGVEVESHGEYRSGVYQELARGFGATDYAALLASDRANETRLRTASEFGKRNSGLGDFGTALLRQVLFAVYQTTHSDDPQSGLNYLHTELGHAYWNERRKIALLLDYLAALGRVSTMPHWRADAASSQLLAGRVRNDHV